MTITKRPNGIEIYTIYKGYLVSEFYIGYTVKEAKRRFVEQYGKGDE
jgi:hypothetical protein